MDVGVTILCWEGPPTPKPALSNIQIWVLIQTKTLPKRFKLINNAAECHEMAKIYTISKLIGLIGGEKKREIPGPRKVNHNITGD